MRVVDFLTEDKWTKGAFARDEEGRDAGSTSSCARKWCVSGAVNRCYSDDDERRDVYIKIHDYLNRDGCTLGVFAWNDDVATWPDVQKMLQELQV